MTGVQTCALPILQSQYAGVDAYLSLIPPGATLCDAQGVHDIPVAEWIVTAILASLKYIPFYVRLRIAGDWKQRIGAESLYLGMHPDEAPKTPPALEDELTGKTVLIVGYGSIGRATEERLKPFGVNVLRVSRRQRDGVEAESRLDDLLPQADVVVLLLHDAASVAEFGQRLRQAAAEPRAHSGCENHGLKGQSLLLG